jgi:hypothetical protein
MKITTSVTLVFLSLALTISLWGCGGGKDKGPSGGDQNPPGTFNIGGVVFKMKQIPNKSFPIGVTDSTTPAGTVDRG